MKGTETRFFIRKALRFLSGVIDSLDEADKKNYANSLETMRRRLHDPEFRLAIVGNFNCGKSTFLNALIGEELLTTDNLPTTAIPTYMRWNKTELLNRTGHDDRRYYNPIVTITMSNRKIYTLTKSGKKIFEQETQIALPDKLGSAIDTLTTTNALIGKISRVDLTFREKEMFANFCLIDTPGINPGATESKEHTLQTQKVLREEADALVVLYTFKDAMNRGTEEFMKDDASHLMAGAIILLTKMDLVPSQQVEKIFRNTKRLVKERYGQKNPKVYGVAALSALEYRLGISEDAQADAKWADDFDKTVTEIITQLSDRRTEIISRRILELMNALIESLKLNISKQLMKLEQEREVLAKASIENLQREIQKASDEYIMPAISAVKCFAVPELRNYIHSAVEDGRQKINSHIEDAESINELNTVLQKTYPAMMNETSKKIYGKLMSLIIEPLNQKAYEYLKQAEDILNKYNKYIGAITPQDAKITNDKVFQVSAPPVFVEDSFSTDLYVGILKIILPFVGGAVDRVRMYFKIREAKKLVQESLYNYEANFYWDITKIIEQTINKNKTWSDNLIEEYRTTYSEGFDAAERYYNERVKEVERNITQSKENIARLEDLKRKSLARTEG